MVAPRKREEERKTGREGESALNKRQGGPSRGLEQSLEPAQPADLPVPQPGRHFGEVLPPRRKVRSLHSMRLEKNWRQSRDPVHLSEAPISAPSSLA